MIKTMMTFVIVLLSRECRCLTAPSSRSARGRPRITLAPAQLASAISLYNGGEAVKTIANKFGISSPVMYRELREAGLGRTNELTICEDTLLKQVAQPGATMASVASQYNISTTHLRRIIGGLGLTSQVAEARSAARTVASHDLGDALVRAVREGEPLMRTAMLHNLSWITVQKRLRLDAGLAARMAAAKAEREHERRASAEQVVAQLSTAFAAAEAAAKSAELGALNTLAEAAAEAATVRRAAGTAQSSAPSEAARREDAEMVKLRTSGLTLQEIAQVYGVSRERIRQRLQRCGLSGSKFSRRPSSAEIESLGCVLNAATALRADGSDFAAAMEATLTVAAAHGLRVSASAVSRIGHSRGGQSRKQRRSLLQDLSLAEGMANGEKLADLGRRLGLRHPSNVPALRLERLGLHRKRLRRGGCAARDADGVRQHPYDAAIRAALAEGESGAMVALRLELSEMYVSKRARAGQVTLDGACDEELRALRLDGISCMQIAERMGRSRNWVSTRVTLLGLPPFITR